MVADQILNIAHDLRIALVGVGRDGFEALAMFVVDGGGLRMEHEGHGQEALGAG